MASLGRTDRLDPDQIDRLITALVPYGSMEVLEPERVSIKGAREYGTVLVLDHLWRLLGCSQILDHFSQDRSFGFQPSLAVKAMVFSRVVDPCSERGVLRWLEHVHAPKLEGLQLQHLYRSLDFLSDIKDELELALVHSLTARLFSDLRLVLFDTTSVYFEGRGPEVLASYGYSRDRRPDRRQFILGLLTSREGLPIAHVVLPGSTSDLKALQTALQSLVEKLPVTEVIMVMDRGMVSDENLRELQEAGIQYIVGAKLRHLKTRQALAIAGRYQVVADNLRVKEVKLEEDRRHIICYNPIEAERDREQREAMVAYLEEKLSQGVKGLLKNGVARRYLRIKGSKVSLDREKIKNDAQYDGKWVLLTTTSLPAEEVALSYKGLW